MIKGLTSQFINRVDCFIRQCFESNNGHENALRYPCSKCKNKKIIHSKIMKEYLLRWEFVSSLYLIKCIKYEFELRNINLNIMANEIQEKISEGFAKCFRNEDKIHKVQRNAEEDTKASAGLVLCYLDHEHQRLQRVKDIVLKVYVAFNDHMQWLFEHNQLAYIPFPLMMPLVRAIVSANTSNSTLTAAAAGNSKVPIRDSSIPSSPSIHAPKPTSPLPDLMDGVPLSSRDAT
ncbi:hypothetical protein M9H77_34856 [Catharanthus roseus]|uniref:Uncharacterized protein n=1 Tax=Catharanthus roseus TaxID=4058 RepID=A0ACB9ZPW5_CATRO|nr:hypothetical protein M9H77_34856 [Catharanthus roseus]